MFVSYLFTMARSSRSSEVGVKSRPLVAGNSLEDIFGSNDAVVVRGGGGDGGLRRRKATALMSACQHELSLDVAIIIRKKVGVLPHSALHCTSLRN